MFRLKEIRESKGILQKDLAVNLNINASTLNQYENEKRQPNFKTLCAIADYFDCSIDYLLGRTDNPNVNR
ncbi:MAG: helix-turn-helix domain-containing protein [Oscillospiraceae bacterium]|nr:helix-turn-helix domain-containing protein [Oscillospiraceae bacterium]